MHDELLEYLGIIFVSEDIQARANLTFDSFIELYGLGYIQEANVA